jgi:hypothetical protein
MKTLIKIFTIVLALTFINVDYAEANSLNKKGKYKVGVNKKKKSRSSAKRSRMVDVSRCPYKSASSKVDVL